MKIGDRVNMCPRKKGLRGFDGTVVKFDGDDCIGNPEEFLTVRADDGQLWGFRRQASAYDYNWTPRARTLLKIKGAWKCELIDLPARAGDGGKGEGDGTV